MASGLPTTRQECGGMDSVSSTSPLHGACKVLVGGTKISAELNNL
jgi:hypothetical protein